MNRSLDQFQQIVDAEEYFQFFDLPYDPQFININRLHILRKFSALIQEVDTISPNLSEPARLEHYRIALQAAYETFTNSSPQQEKLFKVFHRKPEGVVMLSDIKAE
jgi:nitrogenase-stabilizing/protective protein